MSDLRPNLFDTDFEQLVSLARSLLPKFAPTWTDHNLHDPGIMLIELLAWTAEAQTYSLARMRNDERWAYGALLGIEPRGPLPASGLVWPSPDFSVQEGRMLETHIEITADQPQVPPFRLSHAINQTGARLVALESRLRDGRILNHTETNTRPGASYYPFGEQADAGDRFMLSFQGPLLAPQYQNTKTALLALGVRVPPETLLNPSALNPDDVGKQKRWPLALQLVAILLDGQFRYPLAIKMDGTDGFLRTGVILLDLSKVPQNLNQEFKIEFESRHSGLVGPPRILCIKPNVLPIEQLTEATDLSGWNSRGLPDQQLNLEKSGIVYSSSSQHYAEHHESRRTGVGDKDTDHPVNELMVAFGQETWRISKDLSACGPTDAVFLFDPIIRQIRFGNGINGKIPPAELSPTVTYQVTEGPTGNIPAGLKWKVQGIGDYGTNQDPTNGGSAALNLAELRRLARVSVRKTATIVTSTDLEQAAYALPDLRVARAEALPMPDLGEHCSVLVGTRTLVALRARSPASTTTESSRWLAEVQRQLVPRLLLGERLRVVAPDYLPLQIQATLRARSGYDPKVIEEQVLKMLEKLFILVPVVTGDVVWPLGRAVELLDIKARLRNVEGVAGVKDCALIWGGPTVTREQPKFSSRFLPLWQNAQSRIVVERIAMEASS